MDAMSAYVLILIAVFSGPVAVVATDFSIKDYCLEEAFDAECGGSDVILIESAFYGRMEFGTCVQRNYGYIGCRADVTRTLANKCSARKTCEVVNIEALFASFNKCPQDLKAYLQASYSCRKVTQPLDPNLCAAGYVEPSPPPLGGSGLLASVEKRWGTSKCPWRIQGQPGQRINLTLHDYSDYGNTGDTNPAFCRHYLTILEIGGERKLPSCSHERRDRHLYLSESHDVYVALAREPDSSPNQPLNFLLEFEVVGCTLPVLPSDSYHADNDYTDNKLTVTCNHTGETWTLGCKNGKWEGRLGNCTARIVPDRHEGLIPLGLSIIIIVVVALLVCTGVLLVGFMVIFCKRRTRRKRIQEDTRMFATYSKTHNSATIINARTKHASLEKTRTGYSPLTKTRSIRHHTGGGEYTHIWEVKHPIPVATPEIPKTHFCFHQETITSSRSSPTMTSARSASLTSARSPTLTSKRAQTLATKPSPKLTSPCSPTLAKRSHTLQSPTTKNSPIAEERPAEDIPRPAQGEQEVRLPRLPTFSTFKPDGELYECPRFKPQPSQCSSHSSQSSPLYFEIDTRKKATNHYST